MKEAGHINLMAFPNPYFNQLPYGYPYSSLPNLPPFLPPPFPYDSLRQPHPLLSPNPLFFHQQNNYFPDPQVTNPFFQKLVNRNETLKRTEAPKTAPPPPVPAAKTPLATGEAAKKKTYKVVEIIELSDSEQPAKRGKAGKEKERQPKRKPDYQIQKNAVLDEEETRRISRYSRRQRREAEQAERARLQQERAEKEREQARIRHMVRLQLSNLRLLQKAKTAGSSDILMGPEHQADLPLHLASQDMSNFLLATRSSLLSRSGNPV